MINLKVYTFALLFFIAIIFVKPVFSEEKTYRNLDYLSTYIQEQEKTIGSNDKSNISNTAIKYNKSDWNKMREGVEKGYAPGTYIPKPQKTKKEKLAEEKKEDTESALSLELPYESGLSIKGVKTIDLKYTYKKYDQDQAKNSRENQTKEFDMQQTLVVNIKGKVGRKISVNVDFDDTREVEQKRDISVVYKGDPEEVVQEFAFGDINLSLPSTEFVSYNKQVFGLKADLKYKRLKLLAIGSRTKGITETKKYSGNTTLEKKDINDNSYIRRRYYKLALDTSHISIIRGSEKVYIDDRDASNNTPETETLSAEAYAVGASSYTGSFDLMSPGIDYTVDYDKGIITFKKTIAQSCVIAVNYKKPDGSEVINDFNAGMYKIIKDENEQTGITRELKNYYNIGRNKIVRDNGRGNFIMKIIDLSRGEVSVINPGTKPLPIYLNNDNTNIVMDFDSGIFYFKNEEPFPADVYSISPKHYYMIFTEYHYCVKTYLLRANIVPNSDRIVVNGKKLQRDIDYFIDYISGFVTFYNEDMIDENSSLEISYEYAPFGGELGQTLVGIRSELSLTNNLFVGSSFLYNFAPKPTTLPTTSSTPSSIKVMEFDTNLKEFKIGNFPLKMDLAAEYAQSRKNPNTFGRAIVESMEGIKQEDSVSMNKDLWLPSSNLSGKRWNLNDQSIYNEDIKVLDINPNSDSEDDETQQVLNLSYKLDSTNDEASYVYTFSKSGLDFSEKLYLEGVIYGDNSNNQILISLGGIAEDADSDGILDKEDINGDNTINEGEDIGWAFNNADGTVYRVGDDNGRLDTEDLDGDGSLDSDNGTGTTFGSISNPLVDIAGNTHSQIDWPANTSERGWKTFQIPLNITTTSDWQAIKNIRVTIKYGGVTAQKAGLIKIASLAVVGNKFEKPTVTGTGTMDMIAVNNVFDTNYESLLNNADYMNLYKDTSENTKEQALEMRYKVFSSSSQGYTKVVYTKAMDFTAHKKLSFFVWNDGNAKTAFVQFGSESSYYEINAALDQSVPPGWNRYQIKLVDVNGDHVPDIMRSDDYRNVTVVSVGSPSLKSISQIKLGVKNSGTASGMVRFNEIYLSDVEERIGEAKRLQGDFTWPGWVKFGGKYKTVDRNFETITSDITNQDRKDESAYANITRIPFMPINVAGSRSTTITPSSVDTGESGLVSSLQEGRVVSKSGSASTNISIPKLPSLGLGYNYSNSISNTLMREDLSDTYNGTFDYSVPISIPVINPFPSSLSSSYSLGKVFTYYRDSSKKANPVEISQNFSGRASFKPISILTFNPNYSWSQSKENQRFPDDPIVRKYEKTLSQKAGASSSLSLFSWLEPNFDYSINIDENNDLLITTATAKALGTKSVTRSASGRIDWTFVPNKLIGDFTPTKSLSLSSDYSINDGDSYEYIRSDKKILSFDMKNLFFHKKGLFDDSISTSTASSLTSTSYSSPLSDYKARLKSLTWRDTINLNGKWKPIEWIRVPDFAKPITDIYTNLYFSDSKEHTENTGTKTDTDNLVWPKYNLNINNTEKLFFAERFFSNSNVNYAFSKKRGEVRKISRNFDFNKDTNWSIKTFNILDWYFTYNDSRSFDYDLVKEIRRSNAMTFSWSSQVGFNLGKWRFTPNHATSKSKAYDSLNVITTDKRSITESLKIRGDLDLPKVVRLPFFSSAWILANRMIIDINASMSSVKSSLNVESDNTKTYTLSTTVDYEISKNLRMAVSLGGSKFKNLKKSDESYMTMEGSTKMTIQF